MRHTSMINMILNNMNILSIHMMTTTNNSTTTNNNNNNNNTGRTACSADVAVWCAV